MADKDLISFKGRIMKAKGYHVDHNNPDDVKYEVAEEQGIPLEEGANRQLTSRQAGKVGGPIGGTMVKEMIHLAKEQITKK